MGLAAGSGAPGDDAETVPEVPIDPLDPRRTERPRVAKATSSFLVQIWDQVQLMGKGPCPTVEEIETRAGGRQHTLAEIKVFAASSDLKDFELFPKAYKTKVKCAIEFLAKSAEASAKERQSAIAKLQLWHAPSRGQVRLSSGPCLRQGSYASGANAFEVAWCSALAPTCTAPLQFIAPRLPSPPPSLFFPFFPPLRLRSGA
jgi:hypothetical protein